MIRIHGDNHSLLLEMCRLLNAIEVNNDMKTICRDHNVVSVLISIMRDHVNESKLQRTILKILLKLTYSRISREEILLQGGDDTVTTLIKCHEEDPEVIKYYNRTQ